MFYKDVGILPALIVFGVIVGLYSLVIFVVGRSKRFEELVEGKPVCLIKDGVFSINNFSKETVGEEEFFSELRLHGVSQLGQIEEAIIETSGNISIFYYQDDEVKFGLPIMPGSLENSKKAIKHPGHYSCIFCGYTKQIQPCEQYTCPTCKKLEWVESSIRKRVQ